MKAIVRIAIVGCVTTVAAFAGASASGTMATGVAAQDGGTASSLPACVGVGTEVRYVPYGYNHVVVLKNGCSKNVTCSVSTDVNPQATSVEVASAATVNVLTFTASPAQTFTARVSCILH